jgi:Tfp pilus assembly protein PilV
MRNPSEAAFSLVEVVIALAVFAFVGIALLGLLSVGLQNSQDSRERTQAASIAEQICAIRRAAPTNDFTGTAPQPGFPLPILNTAANNISPLAPVYLSQDGTTNTTAGGASFGLLYNIIPQKNLAPTGASSGVATVYLCLYWPAKASPTNGATSRYELATTFALP